MAILCDREKKVFTIAIDCESKKENNNNKRPLDTYCIRITSIVDSVQCTHRHRILCQTTTNLSKELNFFVVFGLSFFCLFAQNENDKRRKVSYI